MHTNTQIHVEYLGEYVSRSIILEPVVLNKREIEERARRYRADTLGIQISGNEWEVWSIHSLGHLYRQCYLQVTPGWGSISNDTTLAAS
jgi:hypothetical protein